MPLAAAAAAAGRPLTRSTCQSWLAPWTRTGVRLQWSGLTCVDGLLDRLSLHAGSPRMAEVLPSTWPLLLPLPGENARVWEAS